MTDYFNRIVSAASKMTVEQRLNLLRAEMCRLTGEALEASNRLELSNYSVTGQFGVEDVASAAWRLDSAYDWYLSFEKQWGIVR